MLFTVLKLMKEFVSAHSLGWWWYLLKGKEQVNQQSMGSMVNTSVVTSVIEEVHVNVAQQAVRFLVRC
jgi:hypothetical protein